MSPRSIPSLRHVISRTRPSLLHAHTAKAALLARAVAPRTPLVATAHNEFSRGTYVMGLANRIITVSDQNRKSISRWAGAKRTCIVRNGVLDGARLSSQKDREPIALVHPSVVFVGGMNERKGIPELLEAFKAVILEGPDGAMLYLVGDGPDKRRFENLAASLDISRSVKFVGFDSAPYRYMLSADVFVLPSREEPFGLVLAEARQAGCAIVATNIGGIPEVLEGGRAGRLVPANDASALGREIRSLLDDSAARASLAASAQSGLQWLTVSRMEAETRCVYEGLNFAPKAGPR
jgi:glycosyltransferase involved in cell wall biosynthesis